MGISEFKKCINLIVNFAAKINEDNIPNDAKKTMVKTYANTLRINLTDRMAYSIIYNCLS